MVFVIWPQFTSNLLFSLPPGNPTLLMFLSGDTVGVLEGTVLFVWNRQRMQKA